LNRRPDRIPPLRERLALAILLAACAAGCGDQGDQPPKASSASSPGRLEHVILISLDTLRADHCSLYGYEKPTTPFLEELAARGVVFENHMVSANNTLMSHASLMTGLYPLAHDTYDKGEAQQALAPPFRTAAELFGEVGFDTGAFTTNKAWLGREFGVMQGFDHVEADWVDNITCWKGFLKWFDATEPRHSFTFLHFFDPHSESDTGGGTLPYESTEELIKEFAPPRPEDFTGCLKDEPNACTSRYLGGINEGLEALPPEHLEYLMGLYDAGVRKMDDDLRLLFAELDERGLLDSSLIAITSDHGEEFMEHGRLLHGGISDAIMHVPLLFLFPEGHPVEPRRISEVTRSIDVAPTLLDFFDLLPIGQGMSLRGVIERRSEPVDSEVFFGPAVLRARDAQGLYKVNVLPKAPVFYDLEQDPYEQHNLCLDESFLQSERYRAAAARVLELRNTSTKVRNSLKKGQSFGPAAFDDESSQRAAEALRNLGYVDLGDDDE